MKRYSRPSNANRLKREVNPSGHNPAASTLKKLLSGQQVVRPSDTRYDLNYPEVRLYFDGVLEEREGHSEFRCEAARLAAERALTLWEQRP